MEYGIVEFAFKQTEFHKLKLIPIPKIVQWLLNKISLGSHQNTCFSKIVKWITETDMSSLLRRIILSKYSNVNLQYRLTTSIHGVASVHVGFFVVNQMD